MKCLHRAAIALSILRKQISSTFQSIRVAMLTQFMGGQTIRGKLLMSKVSRQLGSFSACQLRNSAVKVLSIHRFYGIGGPRTAHMSNMLLSAKVRSLCLFECMSKKYYWHFWLTVLWQRWVEAAHPFWNRTQGRDHIWLASHDEGSCWVPEELR